MKSRPWQRMVKQEVLPLLPELVLTGSLLHLPDTEWLLCGALKNNSAFSGAFYVEVVVVPLYVPKSHLGWQVGERLGRLTGDRDVSWRPDTQSEAEMGRDIADRLRRGGVPFWRSYGDLRSFAAACRQRPTYRIDVNLLEAVAGAAVILGDGPMARDAFSAVHHDVQDDRDWAVACADRIRELEHEWVRDQEAARELLRTHRDRTATHLGLA